MTRRMILALMTITNADGGYLFIILMISLTLYLTIHAVIQPFKYTRVNRMETICIFILIVVLGFVGGTDFGMGDSNIGQTILALFLLIIMLIPLCMVIYEGWRFWKHSKTSKISKSHYDKIQNRRARGSSHTNSENDELEMADRVIVSTIKDAGDSSPSDSDSHVNGES